MSLKLEPFHAAISFQFRHNLDPDPWSITFGVFQNDDTILPGDILGACVAAWNENVMDFMDSQVTFVECQGRFADMEGGDPLILSIPGGQAGTGSGPKLPQNCALHVKKSTTLGGRKGKGRFFVPGILSSADVSETGILASTPLGDYQVAFTGFLDQLESGGGEWPPAPMCVLHNTLGVDDLKSIVTQLTVDSMISTQRRRLR